jgi:hypothetical protein
MIMALAVFPGWIQLGLTLGLFLFLELTLANFTEPWCVCAYRHLIARNTRGGDLPGHALGPGGFDPVYLVDA